MNDTFDYTINVKGRLFCLKEPVVMGILNCTPDSFYAGSRKQTEKEIADRARQIVAEGGAIIDVGAFSTRPGADEVSPEEECRRLQTALEIVRRETPDTPISVDTYRPAVARRCIEEWGADIINDVSEGGITGIANVPLEQRKDEYPEMFRLVGELKVPYILMSVQKNLHDMLINFSKEVQQLRDLAAKDIILDPGFGFGKTLEENYRLMNEMEKLMVMELPLLVGISRKSMIFKLLGNTPAEALNGTTVLDTISLLKGARILRVHDVNEACEAVRMVKALNNNF
jgi:dihydropteroate synthase